MAKNVGILTLLAVCDGVQKMIRESHLFILDGETMGWVFFLCLVLLVVKLQCRNVCLMRGHDDLLYKEYSYSPSSFILNAHFLDYAKNVCIDLNFLPLHQC